MYCPSAAVLVICLLKPGLIYFAPIYFTMATPVYKVNSADKADIIIYWVDSKEKAKWIK